MGSRRQARRYPVRYPTSEKSLFMAEIGDSPMPGGRRKCRNARVIGA
jgi:hypothetical protein